MRTQLAKATTSLWAQKPYLSSKQMIVHKSKEDLGIFEPLPSSRSPPQANRGHELGIDIVA